MPGIPQTPTLPVCFVLGFAFHNEHASKMNCAPKALVQTCPAPYFAIARAACRHFPVSMLPSRPTAGILTCLSLPIKAHDTYRGGDHYLPEVSQRSSCPRFQVLYFSFPFNKLPSEKMNGCYRLRGWVSSPNQRTAGHYFSFLNNLLFCAVLETVPLKAHVAWQ